MRAIAAGTLALAGRSGSPAAARACARTGGGPAGPARRRGSRKPSSMPG
ncbi:MAG: hypothetical protein MZV64_42305 [Ignavibacteriales bacterium]|nr:hypothetical protein [Ignavibacteriales bacterium]